ncbi:MAG: zinc ribbon domain-containing protein [Promethearchaeota archaeon]
MKISEESVKKRSYIGVWILIFLVITTLSFILSLLINPIWWILIPLSIFFISIFQLISRYFWLEKNNCPSCNTPISKYAEFCKNCGLKLWFKCLSCGKYLRVNTKFCENCNRELKHTDEEIRTFRKEPTKKDSYFPKMPNFCSNCGKEVKKKGNIKFCEECGEKLD